MRSIIRKKTYKPRICCFPLSSGDWGGSSRVFYTILNMLDTNKLEPLIILPAHGPATSKLNHLNIAYRIWTPLTEFNSLKKFIRALQRSYMFYMRENIDLVYVNGASFWRPAELLAAKLLDIPIIAHYHLTNDQSTPGLNWCNTAIAVSNYVAKYSKPEHLSKTVIYNPVNLARFDNGHCLRRELGINSNSVVVSFLGQIRAIKGIDDFVRMARNIESKETVFLIAGECRDRNIHPDAYTIEDLKSIINNDPRIRYLGYRTDVENIYHTSDIIVVPSRWPEPFGLINIEAGACRLPVVATNVGGVPEIIKDGINGYLVEAGDVRALTERVRELIINHSLRSSIGDRARRIVEDYYHEQPVRDFERLILDIISKHSK